MNVEESIKQVIKLPQNAVYYLMKHTGIAELLRGVPEREEFSKHHVKYGYIYLMVKYELTSKNSQLWRELEQHIDSRTIKEILTREKGFTSNARFISSGMLMFINNYLRKIFAKPSQ